MRYISANRQLLHISRPELALKSREPVSSLREKLCKQSSGTKKIRSNQTSRNSELQLIHRFPTSLVFLKGTRWLQYNQESLRKKSLTNKKKANIKISNFKIQIRLLAVCVRDGTSLLAHTIPTFQTLKLAHDDCDPRNKSQNFSK